MNDSILVIEDCPEMQELMKLVLESADHSVVAAVTGLQALKLLRAENDFSLILLDNGLPDMTAENLLRCIEMEQLCRHSPVVICSAGSDLEKMRSYASVTDVLQKPFEISSLLAIVDKYQRQSNLPANLPVKPGAITLKTQSFKM